MFSQFFGGYLVDNGYITEEQFTALVEYQDRHRAKLGVIAVKENMLTPEQAAELNRLQMQMDMRFGDLAVSKGYLTESDITSLLRLQGNPYLTFVQALDENGIMDLDRADSLIEEFQSACHISNTDMNAIKNSDVDGIVKLFVNEEDDNINMLTALTLKNIVRFVTNHFRIDMAYKVKKYKAKHMCYQRTAGDMDGFLMLACNDDSLLMVAERYGNWQYEELDEDAYDSICEFVNCTNGLYATKLSGDGINVDMLPPEGISDGECIAVVTDMLVVPVFVGTKRFDIVVGGGAEW